MKLISAFRHFIQKWELWQYFLISYHVYLIRKCRITKKETNGTFQPLIPASLRNSWQTGHRVVTALKILCCLLGYDPNQLFVVRLVAFSWAVFSHALGHKLFPVKQLTVTDLLRWKRNYLERQKTDMHKSSHMVPHYQSIMHNNYIIWMSN